VPGRAVGSSFEKIGSGLVIGTAVHKMDFRMAFRCSRCVVDMVTAEVATELNRFGDWDIG
jgi:hypothetical protein